MHPHAAGDIQIVGRLIEVLIGLVLNGPSAVSVDLVEDVRGELLPGSLWIVGHEEAP
jgi:hypothetical protein